MAKEKEKENNRAGGCALTLIGLCVGSIGVCLIWIPFIGIPMILIGLGAVAFGILGGIVKAIQGKVKKS